MLAPISKDHAKEYRPHPADCLCPSLSMFRTRSVFKDELRVLKHGNRIAKVNIVLS
jgi:hypothetical protein